MDTRAAKRAEGEHPIPAVWTAGARVVAGTWFAGLMVDVAIGIGSWRFPTWLSVAVLLPVAVMGAGWWSGRASAYAWAARIVAAAANYKISYPSAEFGDYLVRLHRVTPLAQEPFISVWTATTAVAGLASWGGAVIIAHLKFAVLLEVASVMAAIALGLLSLAFFFAVRDYQLEFRRESIQLYAAQQTAAQRPPAPEPISPARIFRILDVKGLL